MQRIHNHAHTYMQLAFTHWFVIHYHEKDLKLSMKEMKVNYFCVVMEVGVTYKNIIMYVYESLLFLSLFTWKRKSITFNHCFF